MEVLITLNFVVRNSRGSYGFVDEAAVFATAVRPLRTQLIDSFAPTLCMVIPVVEASPTFAHVEYFCACGETDQINPGLVIAVVSHVAGTASPLGAMMSAETK